MSELDRKYSKLMALMSQLDKKLAKLEAQITKLEAKNSPSQRILTKIDKLKVQHYSLNNVLNELTDVERVGNELENLEGLRGTLDPAEYDRRYNQTMRMFTNVVNDNYDKYKRLMKNTKKQVAIGSGVTLTALALLLALKFGPEAIEKFKNSNQNPDGSNPSGSQDKENTNNGNSDSSKDASDDKQPEVEIPELEKQELSSLVKVEDESQVTERAEGLLAYLKALDPNIEYTLEDLTEYLNYKNGFTADEPTQTPAENPTTGTFTDINDEEQLLERVNGIIVPVYNDLAPQYGVDEAYAVDMFNNINGGVVEDPSRESCLDVIRTASVLMDTEIAYAVDMRNKGKSLREESTATIDYGIFFLDGSKAQEIASKISNYRRIMITSPSSKEAEKAAKEFTEFLMNSWYLQGNNGEINLYSIKTSGQAVFLDQLFLNTATLVQANINEGYNITVINPLDGEKITLGQIIEEINEADCQVEKEADNGDVFMQYVNKFSADIDGMFKDAVSNKMLAKEEFTYGLQYNK